MAWAITGAVVMGSMTAYSISEQNKAAVKQQEAVASSVAMNYKLKEQQQEELKAKAGLDLANEAIKANVERGRIQAASAESGVSGLSPLRDLTNSYIQQSFAEGTIISGEDAALRGASLESQSSYLEGLNQVAQLEAKKTTGLNALLQVGASAAGGYMMGAGIGSSLGAGASLEGAGGGVLTNTATGETATLTAANATSMGTVPSGYTFKATNTSFGLDRGTSLSIGSSLVGFGRSK